MERLGVAPGKVLLLGEYAVLEGRAAICAAVDRYARARVAPGPLRVEAKNLGIAWEGAGEPPPALAAACALLSARGASAQVEIDTSEFSQGEVKLGLGSSAAALAALAAALAPDLSPKDRFHLAEDAHRAAQGGIGSGVDVAASTYGGL